MKNSSLKRKLDTQSFSLSGKAVVHNEIDVFVPIKVEFVSVNTLDTVPDHLRCEQLLTNF